MDTKILLAVTEFVDEMFRLSLAQGGFKNVDLRPVDDRSFFAVYRPGDYGLIIGQPSSQPVGMMHGLKLLSEVRKHDRRAKLLVVSGGPHAATHKWCKDLELGEYSYLALPCNSAQLLEAVDRALADNNESAA